MIGLPLHGTPHMPDLPVFFFARISDPGSFFPLLILFIAVFVVLAIVGHRQEKARRQRLTAFAAGENLQFQPERQNDLDGQYPEIEFFQRGHSRHGENFVTGFAGAYGFTAFDYHFTTGSGKNKSRHHYAVIILQPNFPLKPLTIRPEGIFDKVTAAFGWDDIDFESAEFSSRFHVRSQDRRWAYDVLQPLTIEFLLGRGRPTLEMDHWRLMQTVSGDLEPEKITEAIVTGSGLLDRIPQFSRESL
jgi:hypothetical protein